MDAADEEALFARFGRALTFGTGGLRGLLGAGTNRMNIYTVRRAAQALCADIVKSGCNKSIAIAFDSRRMSRRFALETARVAAGNGVKAYLYPRLEPTPALSYAVRYYACGAGVCITASHNPREYNGFKVYGPDGCQITLEAAARIASEMDGVDPFDGVLLAPENDPLIQSVGDECLDSYLDAVLALDPAPGKKPELRAVYTPLNGAGRECMEKLFFRLGISHYTIVPEQSEPDGDFPTCPYPNPEEKSAMALALALAEREQPDAVIGTDPDCDRMAAAVPDGEGKYTLLSGNEIAALMLDYICRTRLAAGTMPKKPVAVTTIVTTDLLTPIALKYGVKLIRTLTGFKFIGEQIGRMEAAGERERFIFGCEESYGYLSGTHVRDKDAVNAGLLLLSMLADAKRRNSTLLSDLAGLYREHGCYRTGLCSFAFPGESGMKKMAETMRQLRERPPAELAGAAVVGVADYEDAASTGLPAADALEFRLADGGKLTVRPSGTEPKIKVYLTARQADADAASARLLALEKAAGALAALSTHP